MGGFCQHSRPFQTRPFQRKIRVATIPGKVELLIIVEGGEIGLGIRDWGLGIRDRCS